jgi:hypothetical protein
LFLRIEFGNLKKVCGIEMVEHFHLLPCFFLQLTHKAFPRPFAKLQPPAGEFGDEFAFDKFIGYKDFSLVDADAVNSYGERRFDDLVI